MVVRPRGAGRRTRAEAVALTPDDHQLAVELATEAGHLLVELRSSLLDQGVSPAELKEEGDRQAHELIVARLEATRPEDSVLSEEGADNPERLDASRTWIVDPLDGTREFGEPPRTDWAVHVALWERAELTAGAVALPALEVTLGTRPASPLPEPHDGRPRIVASRTRPGPAADALVASLGGELLHMGSAGAKSMAVVRGEADIYAHTGGQYEWDSAAPVAVALAAGFHASRLDGSPLVYNRPDPYLPDLLICRPELAEVCLDALRD